VTFEHCDWIEILGDQAGGIEDFDVTDPVNAVGTGSVRLVRPAQQVPASMSNNDSPRVNDCVKARPGL
jgi:hypothetical protein